MPITQSIEELKNKIKEAVNDQEIRKIIKQSTAQIIAKQLNNNLKEQLLQTIDDENSKEELAMYMKNSLREPNCRR